MKFTNFQLFFFLFFILNAACTLTFTLYLYLPLLWNAPIIFIYLAIATHIFFIFLNSIDTGILDVVKEYYYNRQPQEYLSFPSLELCMGFIFIIINNNIRLYVFSIFLYVYCAYLIKVFFSICSP